MDNRAPTRKGSREKARTERRVAVVRPGLPRALHMIKNLWARPLELKKEGKRVKVVLVERRRPRMGDEAPPLELMRTELRERLFNNKNAKVTQVMRHLVLVHDELGRGGWEGVEVLPAQVIGLAIVQAEMLASEEPSRLLSLVIERLRIIKVAADVRDERAARLKFAASSPPSEPSALDSAPPAEAPPPAPAGVEDDGHRNWTGPVPTPLVIRDRES
jgi:hypothetical protein